MISIQRPATAETPPSDAKIAAILRQRIAQEKRSVGIVVGIVDATGSRVTHFGQLSAAPDPNAAPLDGNTIFEIGSITKVFTAVLLAEMAARGDLKLAAPIATLLPAKTQLPTRDGKQITLLTLATHTSGLPRLPTNLNPADVSNPYADYTIAQLDEFLASYQLPRQIGAEYEYSNLGMGLLGQGLSLKAGVDFETLVKTRIAQPLQMSSTGIQIAPEQQKRFATGHNTLGQPVPHWDIPTLAGAGALRSTANDLLKFVAANLELTPSPLSAVLRSTHQEQQQIQASNTAIGLGWHILKQHGLEIVFHDGGTGGFRSFIGFVKSKKLGVVVLSNSENDINDLGLHLLDRQQPLSHPPKQRTAIQLQPQRLDAYVGNYQITPDFILTITKLQDRLFLQATGQPQVELFPESETQFFITQVDAQITFLPNAQGTVDRLILHQFGQQIPATKLR